MENTITEALSEKVLRIDILDNLTIEIKIENNPYNLHYANVFSMAARKNNPQRSYLFVSKLIGKHIPAHPNTPFITAFLLASRLAETWGIKIDSKKIKKAVESLESPGSLDSVLNLPKYCAESNKKILLLGFAETATALGHGVFNYFEGDIHFLHTTRENIKGKYDTLYFSEEHSHAPAQRLLIEDASLFESNDILVLIDDELSSGNTCLNIIRCIHEKYPLKKVFILTILDWRSKKAEEKYKDFCDKFNLEITVVSLLRGVFQVQGQAPVFTNEPKKITSQLPKVKILSKNLGFSTAGYPLKCSGRLGLSVNDNSNLQKLAKEIGQSLLPLRYGAKTLCLGTGEFMYIPFLVSRYMGEGVTVQSTTLSPVEPVKRQGYAIWYSIVFEDILKIDRANFVYNIGPDYYEDVFIFWEKNVSAHDVPSLVQSLNDFGVKNIVFINFV